ncbi:MAG: glycosyltransferase family 2 protein [Firmicutes bacterium]|nr:glycosyltransferase family 2 protein [Bacillota bacterium]
MSKVSILVPVYNVENCLEKCLDSLINQTYKDIEIVVINDGSTDLSKKILDDYTEKDKRIIVRNYKNSGIAITRNRALKYATGDYLMFVDSDDYIDLDMVEVMVHTLEKDQSDICICGFTQDYRYGKLYRKVCKDGILTSIEALHSLVDNRGVNNYPWAKLYKRECFKDVEFPDGETTFEDAYTILRAIAQSKKISTLSKRYYHYVQRNGSLTNRMSLETVYTMRISFEYQEVYLKKEFPNEKFNFNTQYYNADMMILYAAMLHHTRKDHVVFIPGDIDWSKVDWIHKLGYWAWLNLAKIKIGLKVEYAY